MICNKLRTANYYGRGSAAGFARQMLKSLPLAVTSKVDDLASGGPRLRTLLTAPRKRKRKQKMGGSTDLGEQDQPG